MTEAYLHVYAEEETITPDVSVPPGAGGFTGNLERLIAILANRLVMVSGEASVTATPGVTLAQEVAARRALADELPVKLVRAATTAGVSLAAGGLLTGTSAGCPHAAGIVALLRSAGLSPAEARAALRGGARSIGLPAYKQGAGIADAWASLKYGGQK